MKKLFLSISILVLGLVLVSCTESTEFQVDVFIYNYADTYIGGVRADLEDELKGVEGLKFNFHDAANSQDQQSTQIDGAITTGSDLLVVNVVETESADAIIRKAKEAKIPVLFFNREVTDTAVNSYADAAFIGTDPDEAGYMQGELAADILLDKFDELDRNNDGTIGYAMLRADLDNPEANGRTKYSIQEANRLLVAAGKPELVQVGADLMASWDVATAKNLFASLITDQGNFDKIDIVFANNDDMALGVIAALKEKGFNGKDDTDNIPVLGVDATDTAVDAIANGEMAGSIKQDGKAMAVAVKVFIVDILEGKAFNSAGTYTFEDDVKKIRIPYAKYTGE